MTIVSLQHAPQSPIPSSTIPCWSTTLRSPATTTPTSPFAPRFEYTTCSSHGSLKSAHHARRRHHHHPRHQPNRHRHLLSLHHERLLPTRSPRQYHPRIHQGARLDIRGRRRLGQHWRMGARPGQQLILLFSYHFATRHSCRLEGEC